jgi:hypothetical protein
MDHAHNLGAAARGPASRIDGQILALWRGLRSNPSLDARWAMEAIDRLLDERPRLGQALPTREAILVSVVRQIPSGEPR